MISLHEHEETDMRMKILVCVVSPLGLVAAIGSAGAGDNKAYPGSACKPSFAGVTSSEILVMLQNVAVFSGVIFNQARAAPRPARGDAET
jgi:hypothetical protein